MISPVANQVAAKIIASKTGVNYNIFGPSRLAQKCAALIEADRFLRDVDRQSAETFEEFE
jgi:hypothetical protein